jgi:imidazole glycerol-phosphate synthase subunit HisH
MAKVSIVDYGVGNIRAFMHIYRQLNIGVTIVKDPDDLSDAERIILPGVGSFDWAMDRLDASGLRDALDRAVMQRSLPVLGVCVGLQMMANRSEEGKREGLGWIPAEVVHFDSLRPNSRLPVPHMGWNEASLLRPDCALLKGLRQERFYFLHSYCMVPLEDAAVVATTRYGAAFACAVNRGNIYATQFHPEKSHRAGISILRNFASI